MSKQEEMKESLAGLVAHILVSILFISIGVCMMLVNTDIISTIVYSFSIITLGILFVCFGAFYMIRYFFNHEYVKVSNYGFTTGVILIIIGALFIFKAAELSIFIDSIVCFISIILGAIMIQQAFALFHIKRSSWIFCLLFSLVTICASVYCLVSQVKFFTGDKYSCAFLITIGAISLISLLLMSLGLKNHNKFVNQSNSRNKEDIPVAQSADDMIFVEEQVDISDSPASNTSEISDSAFED